MREFGRALGQLFSIATSLAGITLLLILMMFYFLAIARVGVIFWKWLETIS